MMRPFFLIADVILAFFFLWSRLAPFFGFATKMGGGFFFFIQRGLVQGNEKWGIRDCWRFLWLLIVIVVVVVVVCGAGLGGGEKNLGVFGDWGFSFAKSEDWGGVVWEWY